jgi:hypothetical protein
VDEIIDHRIGILGVLVLARKADRAIGSYMDHCYRDRAFHVDVKNGRITMPRDVVEDYRVDEKRVTPERVDAIVRSFLPLDPPA